METVIAFAWKVRSACVEYAALFGHVLRAHLSKASFDVLKFWGQYDDLFLVNSLAVEGAELWAQRLLARQLPVRALVYSSKILETPNAACMLGEGDSWQDRAIECKHGVIRLLRKTCRSLEDRSELESEILKEATRIANLTPARKPQKSLDFVALSDPPSESSGSLGDALVRTLEGTVERFQDHMPIDQWANAYRLNKKMGYVFADRGWGSIVYLAAERILWQRYFVPLEGEAESPRSIVHFKCGPNASSLAKIGAAELHRLREILDVSEDLQACWPLRALYNSRLIADLAAHFKDFDGASSWRVTQRSLQNFHRQFPVRLQPALSDLLKQIIVFDRTHIVPLIHNLLMNLEDPGPWSVFPFTPNSGARTLSWVEQDCRVILKGRCEWPKTSVTGELIATVDDLISSGSQAIAQLEAWSGIPNKDRTNPREQNVSELSLSEDDVTRLKQSKIRLLFAHGSPAAGQKVEHRASTLGFKDLRVFSGQEIPLTDIGKLNSELVTHLREKGKLLLMATGQTEEQASVNALGYDGRTALIIGQINVPTCCPPALWCPGNINGVDWLPLFIRRGYQKHAVFT